MFKKLSLLLILTLLSTLTASAYDAKVGGIYYILHTGSKEATVTYYSLNFMDNNNAYKGDVIIPETIRYNGVKYDVTSIGQKAFSFGSITSVTIPNSVTSIEEGAFSNISKLKSITLPNSVTYIGEDVFSGCTGVLTVDCNLPSSSSSKTSVFYGSQFTSVIFGDEVKKIEDYVFEGNTYLQSVTIGKNVLSIGQNAFKDCNKLTSVTIGNRVTSIGDNAFNGCSRLTLVNIPNNVTSIGNSAFYGCSGLTSITIPSSVTSIEWGAFYGCSGLTSVIIPNSITSIGDYAFRGCSHLSSISIPPSVKSIGENAFYECSGLSRVNITDIAAWCKINFSVYSNPLSYAHHLYINDNEIKYLVIPNSVTSIGSRTFYGCSGLTEVTIPNSVKSIGACAFIECSGLTSITIPNSVTSIGNEAFENCSGLKSVTIGDGVKSIGKYAFRYCFSLETVYCYAEEIPQTGVYVFQKDYSTTNTPYWLYVPKMSLAKYSSTEPWKSFGIIKAINYLIDGIYYELNNNTNLATVTSGNGDTKYTGSVTIPSTVSYNGVTYSVTSIGNEAFYGCSGLTSITIPSSVTSIEWGAFYGCSSLTSVTIPNSITSIGDFAFGGCYIDRNKFVNNSTLDAEANEYWECNIIDSREDGFWISNDVLVKYVGSENSITIPNNVTSIGGSAFYGCSGLTSVIIPNSVTNIGGYAFYGCSKLTDLYCYAEKVPTTINTAFQKSSFGKATLHVPEASVETYEATSPWQGFGKIVALPEPVLRGDANGDGEIGMPDVMFVVNHILGNPAETFNEKAADANLDGKISMPDAMFIVNKILKGKFPDE